MVVILTGKSVLWGLLILSTVAVSLNFAAAADPYDNNTNPTYMDSMWLTIHDLHGDTTNFTDSVDNSTSDTPDITGVVIQARNYTCGPAALATLLHRLGINATEDELASLAGTGEDGTTMQGLIEAARAKGVKLTGMKLNITELGENMIVHLTINGTDHYSLITAITQNTIKLADPTQGNIELSLKEFQRIYSGYALLQDNQTTDKSRTLTAEETQNIKGKGLRWSYRWRGWYPVRVRVYYGFNMARCLWGWDIDGARNYANRYMNWYRRVGYRYAA